MTSPTLHQFLCERQPVERIGALNFSTDDLNEPRLVGAHLTIWGSKDDPLHDVSWLIDSGGDPRNNESFTGINWELFQKAAVELRYVEEELISRLTSAKVNILVLNQCAWNKKVLGFNGMYKLLSVLNKVPQWYLSESEAVRECHHQTFFDYSEKDKLEDLFQVVVDMYSKCSKRRRLSDYAQRLLGPQDFREWDGSVLLSDYTATMMRHMTTKLLGMTKTELREEKDEVPSN